MRAQYNDLTVHPVPCLSDNYAWLIEHPSGVTVVDPGEYLPVEKALGALKKPCTQLLLTHHHSDHIGGAETLLRDYPQALVCGPWRLKKRFNLQNQQGDTSFYDVISSINWNILQTPGHTKDHISFYTKGHVFCGDVLFSAGCGRILENEPASVLFASVNTLNTLPSTTKIYPGHEYTLANLTFANTLEPNNPDVQAAIQRTEQTRKKGLASLPTTLEQERRINPFLRTQNPSIRHHPKINANEHTSCETVFARLRALKDAF